MTPDTVLFALTRTEWRCVALCSGMALGPDSLPGIVGYQLPGDIKVFTGAVHHPEDTMSYLVKMLLTYDAGAVRTYELREWRP